MTKTVRKFVDPETGKPDDRGWLDFEAAVYIKTKQQRFGRPYSPRSEREVYEHFAPTSGGWQFSNTRPSWQSKKRKVKRQMLAASLRRLLAIGKITICDTDYPNRKSMNGHVLRVRESDRRLFGQDHDGVIRYYAAGSVLDALVKALGDIE